MLILSLLTLLLSNAVTTRRDKSILYSRIAIIILLLSSYLAFESLTISLEAGIGLFGGLFNATPVSQSFQIFIFLISAIILQLTGFYPRKIWFKEYSSLNNPIIKKLIVLNKKKVIDRTTDQFNIIEYPLIILFIVTGATFLVSSSDIVSIFLSIELQSYGLYLLSTLYRNSELATSAGLTYFLLGGLSSCFIILGTSLLYANSGTTGLDGFYIISSLSDISKDNKNEFFWYKANYINFSLLIMSVGFLFKVSAAPFHFWSPDVYDAIPTIVTTFVVVVAKISIFIFLLEIVHYTSNSYFSPNFNWTSSLILSSFLSLIIGTVLGLTQFRIKRLFAYSTISHIGFILLALAINTLESIQAFIFYLMQYSISNLNAFILLISIGFSLYTHQSKNKDGEKLSDKVNSPIQLINQIKGYFYLNPIIALSLAITIFSFVGIPPLIGFFAKQMVLSAALDNGYVFLTLVAILTSVISAVYYLNIIKEVFFYKHDYCLNPEFVNITHNNSIIDNKQVEEKKVGQNTSDTNSAINNTYAKKNIIFKVENVVLSSYLSTTISTLTLIILLFIFNPQEWLSIANILALVMFNP